jgi:hypothetical protein
MTKKRLRRVGAVLAGVVEGSGVTHLRFRVVK